MGPSLRAEDLQIEDLLLTLASRRGVRFFFMKHAPKIETVATNVGLGSIGIDWGQSGAEEYDRLLVRALPRQAKKGKERFLPVFLGPSYFVQSVGFPSRLPRLWKRGKGEGAPETRENAPDGFEKKKVASHDLCPKRVGPGGRHELLEPFEKQRHPNAAGRL